MRSQNSSIIKQKRGEDYEYKKFVLWLTGLPAAGKTTVGNALYKQLHQIGVKSYLIDGDQIRSGLNSDLGFSPEDRRENNRRIAEISKLFLEFGYIVIVAVISPSRKDRAMARILINTAKFIEVFVSCPISVCIDRDPKGIYEKGRRGLIKEITGLTAPYEEPEAPEIIIQTDKNTVNESVNIIMNYLINATLIARSKDYPLSPIANSVDS